MDDQRFDDKGQDDRYLIAPDYKKETIQVYIDAARYIFARDFPHRLLSYASKGFFSKPSEAGNLPSWCPDWSREPHVQVLSHSDPEIDYHAGGDEDMPPRIAGSNESPSLIPKGRVTDTIKLLGKSDFLFPLGTADKYLSKDVLKMYQCTLEYEGIVLGLPFKGKMYPYTKPPQPLLEEYWRSLCGDRKEKMHPAPKSVAERYQNWLSVGRFLFSSNVFENPWQRVTEEMRKMTGTGPDFGTLIPTCAVGRRLCVTKLGYIGFVPPLASEDDVICLIQGAQVPFVLRPAQISGSYSVSPSVRKYQLVGEAYVHGVMDGELIGREMEEVKMQELEII